MMYFLESGYTSLNKLGEELCGDKVECDSSGNTMTFVLADGLGSGVKANILATLTSKILCKMVSDGIGIEDCVETILQSLPVCKQRGIAYSTFSVVHIDNTGKGYLVEFDTPPAVLLRNEKCVELKRMPMQILGKTIFHTDLELEEDDVIVQMSDGVMHAGVGKKLNFGWQRDEITGFLECTTKKGMSASNIACTLADACNSLYMGEPGDDTTIAALRVRTEKHINLMIGPPVNKEQDNYYIGQFLDGGGTKVVCGGTSSQIVAKYLNKDVYATFDFPDPDVPPIGYIDGIDLVTEGVLTMRKLIGYVEVYASHSDLTPKSFTKKDGASLLAQLLCEDATHINFFVGQAVNDAHSGLPIDITMKLKLVERLTSILEQLGKTVTVKYA